MMHNRGIFLYSGLLFLFVTIALAIRELELNAVYVLAGIILGSGLVSLSRKPRAELLGLIVFGLLSTAGMVWFLAARRAELLWCFAFSFTFSAAGMFMKRGFPEARGRMGKGDSNRLHFPAAITWAVLLTAFLSLSWGVYFLHVRELVADENLRRLAITIFWALSGGGLFYLASRLSLSYGQIGGALIICVSAVKALLYDGTHTAGFFRVAVFGAVGLILLGVYYAMPRKENS